MAARKAQIQAFNEIATAFAVGLALSLPGLSPVRGVRGYAPE